MELKVLRILAALLTVACFISCNDDSSKSTLTVADYFPLEVNNKWAYSNGNIEWTEEVTAYKHIDGKEYAVVLRTYQRSIDTTYYRSEDNNKVYIYFQGEESLFIDFERAKGEEWESYHEFYGYFSPCAVYFGVKFMIRFPFFALSPRRISFHRL